MVARLIQIFWIKLSCIAELVYNTLEGFSKHSGKIKKNQIYNNFDYVTSLS